MYFVVSGSATMIRLRVSGSIVNVALPTPLLGYVRLDERERVALLPPPKPPKPPGNCAWSEKAVRSVIDMMPRSLPGARHLSVTMQLHRTFALTPALSRGE